MEDPAAASSGCDDDKPQKESQSLTTVASEWDASSPPSTSDPNPSPESTYVPTFEADYYNSGYNDDLMRVSEKPMPPLVGHKVSTWLLNESLMTSTSQWNASSLPSTSNPNPSPVSTHASSLEGGYCISDYDNSVGSVIDYEVSSGFNYDVGTGSNHGASSSYNDDIMQGIEKAMSPIVGEKEPLSALAAEFKSGSPIMLEKIKLLGEKYAALRRTRGDGNCFFRSFMFSYLEHILVTQNSAEVERVLVYIEQCRVDLFNLGYAEFTYEDFFVSFTDLLDSCLPGTEASLSLNELLEKACHQMTSDCVVMFLRFVTSAAIQKRAEFFEPFISGISATPVVEFCKKSVEPMGEESEEVQIIALCDALGVPIRVVYLDRSSRSAEDLTANHHDFFPSANNDLQNNGSNETDVANVSTDLSKQENPVPFVTLLYRPGHYDILYPI